MLGSITQREARTDAVSLSLARLDFDSIIAPDVTATFNERLPESSSLSTSSLPARVIATRGRRSERRRRWRGRRESEKDREEGERGSIVSDAGRGARSMRESACFHACEDREEAVPGLRSVLDVHVVLVVGVTAICSRGCPRPVRKVVTDVGAQSPPPPTTRHTHARTHA